MAFTVQFEIMLIDDNLWVVNPVCDNKRHLVCEPYSLPVLHEMARRLEIGRWWFHKDHYDIPKRRIKEIMAKCWVVDEILKIIGRV